MNRIRKFVRREHPAPKPIKTTVINALILPLQMMLPAVLMFAACSALIHVGVLSQIMVMPSPNHPTKDLKIEAPVDPAIAVLKQHRPSCWTGSEKPKAELPGAAIVRFTKGPVKGAVIYTDLHTDVDDAFNEALADAGYGDKRTKRFDVVALCI